MRTTTTSAVAAAVALVAAPVLSAHAASPSVTTYTHKDARNDLDASVMDDAVTVKSFPKRIRRSVDLTRTKIRLQRGGKNPTLKISYTVRNPAAAMNRSDAYIHYFETSFTPKGDKLFGFLRSDGSGKVTWFQHPRASRVVKKAKVTRIGRTITQRVPLKSLPNMRAKVRTTAAVREGEKMRYMFDASDRQRRLGYVNLTEKR